MSEKGEQAERCEVCNWPLASMIESQNDISQQVENWSDAHYGQVYAAKQLAAILADTTPPADIAERARRVAEEFSQYMRYDFRPSLTQADVDALAAIIATEFGGEQAEEVTLEDLRAQLVAKSRLAT